jgi:hypothetical protein
MPQLDQINYFTQVCWAVITFLCFYVVVIKSLSPIIFKSRRLRQSKVNQHYDFILFFDYINVEILYHQWFSLRKIF